MTTPKRKVRSEEELAEIFERVPIISDRWDELQEIDGITTEADGSGSCVFNTYVIGQTSRYESFLRVFATSNDEGVKGYVQWQHSKMPKVCQQTFQGVVKNPENEDGSYLKSGVSEVLLARAVRRYADAVREQ